MRKIIIMTTLCTAFAAGIYAQTNSESSAAQVKFVPMDVYIDSGSNALAAYQFELVVLQGDAKIVGVEGGQHTAFANPPYYDPAALNHNRIIIAAFSTSKDLPKGKTRIATIHMRIAGEIEPKYETKLVVAATSDGNKITATITLEKGGTQL